MKQITLSGAEFPTEAAGRRKLESLVLKINAQTPYAAMEELTLGTLMDRYIVTGKPYQAGILRSRHLDPLAEKVGVPRLSWHCFRHSFRSWLDVIGTAPGQQMTLMRHADISTTMNVYGAGMLDSKREILAKLHGQTVGFCGVPSLVQQVASC